MYLLTMPKEEHVSKGNGAITKKTEDGHAVVYYY
jgi:hypothetical protein